MNCPKCGAANPAGSRFCATCGASLPVPGPAAGEGGPAFSAPRPGAPAPRPKRKVRKGPLVAVLCTALVAVIALGVVLWFTMSDPTNQLLMSIQKSAEALEEYAGSVGHLEGFSENLDALLERREYTAHLSVDAGRDTLSLDMNYSQKSKALDGALTYSNYYEDVDITAQFYATDELVQLSAAPKITEVYGLPLKNLKENLENSYFGQMTGITLPEDFQLNLFSEGSTASPFAACQEELDAFLNSLEATDTGKTSITLGSKSRECTAYDVSWSNNALADLCVALTRSVYELQNNFRPYYYYGSPGQDMEEYMNQYFDRMKQELVEDLDSLSLVFYAYDGTMVGLDITVDGDTLQIRLEGSENLWDTVNLSFRYSNGTTENLCTLWLDVDDTGLQLEAYNRDAGSLMKLSYTDFDGGYRLVVKGDTICTGTLRDSEDGILFSVSADGDTVTLGLEPLEEKPEALSKNYVNILDMSENDWLRFQRDLSSLTD